MTQHTDLIERLRYEPTASQYLSLADLIASLHEDRKNAANALEAKAREIEALRKDAERYWLLRECGVDSYEACGSGDKLDAECDAAIAMKGQP